MANFATATVQDKIPKSRATPVGESQPAVDSVPPETKRIDNLKIYKTPYARVASEVFWRCVESGLLPRNN
jgi:hypothetical protein